MRNKLIGDAKILIQGILQESGYFPDQESPASLEDKESIGYMDLEVSGDKKSVVGDDDTELYKGDTVGPSKRKMWMGLSKWVM